MLEFQQVVVTDKIYHDHFYYTLARRSGVLKMQRQRLPQTYFPEFYA